MPDQPLIRTGAIWKYPIKASIDMPLAATILAVGEQHGVLMLWAAVNPDAEHTETRHFRVIGTGQRWKSEHPLTHLGTIQTPTGYVWHVAEERP